jgi:hypothetical protein
MTLQTTDPYQLVAELEIVYRNGRQRVASLSAREFFDDDEDFVRGPVAEFVWRHAHAYQYLEENPSNLRSSRITVSLESHPLVELTELYWGDQPHHSILRRDFVDGREVYWLRMLQLHTAEGIHSIRLESSAENATGIREHTLILPNDMAVAIL